MCLSWLILVVWFLLCVPAFAGLARLQSLDLSYNKISELPDGPYLDSLESLNLHFNAFIRVPWALVRATALTDLELTYNDKLELADEDLELFGKMRNLQYLVSACLNAAVELIRRPADRHPCAFQSQLATCSQAWAAVLQRLLSDGNASLWPHAGAQKVAQQALGWPVDKRICGCGARPTEKMQLDRREPGRWQTCVLTAVLAAAVFLPHGQERRQGSRGHANAAPHACSAFSSISSCIYAGGLIRSSSKP